MNVDLRELMRERSATAETTVRENRVIEVHRRITRVRSRRAAGAALGVFAVVGAVVVAVSLQPTGHDTTPQPGDTTATTIGDFPQYAHGAELLASAVAELPDTDVSVSVTTDAERLIFRPRCETPMWIILSAGRWRTEGTCLAGEFGEVTWMEEVSSVLAGLDAEPGSPITFTATVTHALGSGVEELPLPQTGAFALGVMRPVPFDEYPLPPRPDVLPPLDGYSKLAVYELAADPDDPLRTVTGTFAWSPQYVLYVASQTPGFIHVSINDVHVLTYESWNYPGHSAGVALDGAELSGIPEGSVVTITAVPEHMTGAWAIWVVPGYMSEPADQR